jgi:hypothetical protein
MVLIISRNLLMERADYSKMFITINSIKKKEAIKLQNCEYMLECGVTKEMALIINPIKNSLINRTYFTKH